MILALILFASIVTEQTEEAKAFLKNLSEQTGTPKCRNCQNADEANLLVFMSFSIPLESWKEWSYALEKKGGVFVLRGIPENSFHRFSQKVLELKKAGVNAAIRIDPEAFEQYGIEAVPTVIRLKEDGYDKVAGNLGLEAALRILEN